MCESDPSGNVKPAHPPKDSYVIASVVALIILLSIVAMPLVSSVPAGPQIVYNSSINVTPREATAITTAGGSFTTIILNATTQTPRWKAYVGNISGKLTLADASSKSIYDWSVASVNGEVYATRNNTIDWSSIGCADVDSIYAEENALNMSTVNADTINRTFAARKHKSFYAGSVRLQNSTCPSMATYINGSAQTLSENALFQEILLADNADRIVYATLINQNASGFNNQRYDFQMIVAENEYLTGSTTYYIYAELI